MSARRRSLYKQKKSGGVNKKSRKKLLAILLPFFIFVLFTFYSPSNNWDGDSKLSLAINKVDGDVLITTFDPTLEEIVNLTIPADTQVSVARQLGERRLKNVWHLGEDEGLSGKLLTETISRNLKFPVYNWADSPAEGFSGQNVLEILRAVHFKYDTSLSYKDRIKIALFSIRVKNIDRINFNLEDFSYLRRTDLVDGEMGYVIFGKVPQRLAVVFSDEAISRKQLRVNIVNSTGSRTLAENLGEVVETLGFKVAAIESREVELFDCLMVGEEVEAMEKISKVLSCEVKEAPVEGNLDVEVKIGKGFSQRF